MESLKRDLRFVARSLARSAGFFLVTVFDAVARNRGNDVDLPRDKRRAAAAAAYPQGRRIAPLSQVDKDGKRMSVSVPNFEDWKAQTRAFEAMAMCGASLRYPR